MFLDSRVFTSSFNADHDCGVPVEDAEQSFLDRCFGMQTLCFPYAYNAILAIKKRQPEDGGT
ncbi:hypothetical protein BKA93DRAFT_822351 [Sparassis latifolia]